MTADPLSIWIVKQLVGFAAKPAGRHLANLILGDPVERALREPTKTALLAAVDAVLGQNTSKENRERAFEIMGMFWTDDLSIGCPPGSTLTEALYTIVARAIDKANAPIHGLPDEFMPTSTLTSLSDELGTRFDGDTFAATFIKEWLRAVKNAAISNQVLHPLADHLNHEQTQEAMLGLEERLFERVLASIQSWYEQGIRDGGMTIERRLQWFKIHVGPADELMHEIHDDYRSGFDSIRDALRSGVDLEDAMRQLKALRQRKITGRRGVVVIARKLLEDRPDGLFGASIDDALMTYLEAVQGFARADAALNDTWFTAYIDKFNRLIEQGADPHLRSNYPEISGVTDLNGQLAPAFDYMLDEAIPKKWDKYVNAYVDLRTKCYTGPSPVATTA